MNVEIPPGRACSRAFSGAGCGSLCFFECSFIERYAMRRRRTSQRFKRGLRLWEYRLGGHSLQLPAVGFGRVISRSDLIALVVQDKNHANGKKRWRDDENQDPALEGLNHPAPGGSRLGIAEGATLGRCRAGRGEREESDQRHTCQKELSSNFHS